MYYEIDHIEYSYANLLFFASMISDLFYASGKPVFLQYRVKGQIPKKWLQVRTRGLSMFGRVGLKDIFVSRNGVRSCSSAYDFTPWNWIIGYRFSSWKYVDRINSSVQPIRYLIW